jgi:hypothetical protein
VAVLADDRHQSSVAGIAEAVCPGLLGGFVVWAAGQDGFVVWAAGQDEFGVLAWFVVLAAVLWPVGSYLAAAALGGYHSAAWSVAWLVVQAGPVECLVGLAQDEFRSWVDDIRVVQA